jgi:adenosylcobyric acid synthase
VRGYEIHHGRPTVRGGEPFLDGCRSGPVWGTSWHGVLENDEFRRVFLTQVAAQAGRDFVPAPGTSFEAVRTARLDALADLVADHLDTDTILRLLESMPAVPTLHTSLGDA